jgi:hypothetical protein
MFCFGYSSVRAGKRNTENCLETLQDKVKEPFGRGQIVFPVRRKGYLEVSIRTWRSILRSYRVYMAAAGSFLTVCKYCPRNTAKMFF